MPDYRKSCEAIFVFEEVLDRRIDDLGLDSSNVKQGMEDILDALKDSPVDFCDYAQSVHCYLEEQGVSRSEAGELVMAPLSVSKKRFPNSYDLPSDPLEDYSEAALPESYGKVS